MCSQSIWLIIPSRGVSEPFARPASVPASRAEMPDVNLSLRCRNQATRDCHDENVTLSLSLILSPLDKACPACASAAGTGELDEGLRVNFFEGFHPGYVNIVTPSV
jgi:hypothetical protein